MNRKEILDRNNINIVGNGDITLLLAHGFGCDQNMWKFMLPELKKRFKVILFDFVGCGSSDPSAFSQTRYSSLQGYVKDMEEILIALDLKNVSVLAHSVSAMIAGITSI
jgi:sigma-B regulation protein RsbQ